MKMKNVIIVLTLILICIVSLSTISKADVQTDSYKPELIENDYEDVFDKVGVIVSAVRIVGVVISFIGIIGLGIKYMMGSVEQKAEYKSTMMPVLIGMIMIFAITNIVSIIYSIGQNISK